MNYFGGDKLMAMIVGFLLLINGLGQPSASLAQELEENLPPELPVDFDLEDPFAITGPSTEPTSSPPLTASPNATPSPTPKSSPSPTTNPSTSVPTGPNTLVIFALALMLSFTALLIIKKATRSIKKNF